jgi:hypothetical protein
MKWPKAADVGIATNRYLSVVHRPSNNVVGMAARSHERNIMTTTLLIASVQSPRCQSP